MQRLKYVVYLFVITVLLSELVFYLLPVLHEKRPPYNTAVLDDKLGWRPKENYHHEGIMYSLDKTPYQVTVTTDEFGFRNNLMRDSSATVGKIMIIGDSFTQAVEVADDKTYHHLMSDALSRSVYAHGMAGYGTLQELMILEEHLERLNPAIVLLQVCSNDFIDNEIELERDANYYVGLRRPYLQEDSTIEYLHPLNRCEQLINQTNFLKFCFDKWRRVKPQLGIHNNNSSEQRIAEEGEDYPAYQQAKNKTARLLDQIIEQVGPDRDLLVFSADDYEPQQSTMAAICRARNVHFLPFPSAEMQKMRAQQETYSIDGYHWNEVGHRVVAEELVKWLQSAE